MPLQSNGYSKMKSIRVTHCYRNPTPSITLPRRLRSTRARSRSTTWKATMRQSSTRRSSIRCRSSWRNAVREETATAASVTSPARLNAASAAAGTVRRSGTAQINTRKSSGSATTNIKGARNAPLHILRMTRSKLRL